MRLTQKLATLACILSLGALLSVPARAQNDHAKDLGTKIMCMCGGCTDAAGKCTHSGGAFAGPCATAQNELKEVADRVASGSSDDLVLQSFVQEYGPTVLISPPAHGFDLWAWLMPFLMLLAGAILVLYVVSRWKRRAAAAPAPKISPELLSRVRHQIGGENDVD